MDQKKGILQKLESIGIAGMERSIKNEVYNYGKGGPYVYAKGLLNAINHKRKNRLEW